jgi:hypothetical protein
MLKEIFPKGSQTVDKDVFFTVASKVQPTFDFQNPLVEQQFVRTIVTFVRESKHEPTDSVQQLLIKTWMDRWPKSILLSFKQVLRNAENKTIKHFLQNLSNYRETARAAKLACELYGWSVVFTNNTSYSGPNRD